VKNQFASVAREMTLVVTKASWSAVIKDAKDLSCAILTYDRRLVTLEDALPIHVSSMDVATRPVYQLFDDVKEGDTPLKTSSLLAAVLRRFDYGTTCLLLGV
jgi:N-methylhydantoinase B